MLLICQKNKSGKYANILNWDEIVDEAVQITKPDTPIEEKWNTLKQGINKVVEKRVPSKSIKKNYSPRMKTRLRNKLKKRQISTKKEEL